MNPKEGLQKEQNLGTSRTSNIKRAVCSYFEFLLKEKGMSHESLVFLHEKIDHFSPDTKDTGRNCISDHP